jgi:hypothetical protein
MFFFQRKNHPQDPPDIRLMKAVKFIDKDLKANRSGVLTEEQRKRIQRGQVWGALFWWVTAIFLAFPVVFIATRQDWQSEPGVWLLGLAAIGCVAAAFWQQSRTKNILLQNQVDSVSGFLSRRVDMVYTGKVFVPIHKLTVGDKTFTVDKKAYDAFEEGSHYTLYYVPQTEQVLSAELTYDAEKEKRFAEPEAHIETEPLVEGEIESQNLSR